MYTAIHMYMYIVYVYKVRFEIKYFYKNVLLFNNWFFLGGGGVAYSILNTPPSNMKQIFFLPCFASIPLISNVNYLCWSASEYIVCTLDSYACTIDDNYKDIKES
jgi:hypothetical protein